MGPIDFQFDKLLKGVGCLAVACAVACGVAGLLLGYFLGGR